MAFVAVSHTLCFKAPPLPSPYLAHKRYCSSRKQVIANVILCFPQRMNYICAEHLNAVRCCYFFRTNFSLGKPFVTHSNVCARIPSSALCFFWPVGTALSTKSRKAMKNATLGHMRNLLH